MFRRRTLATASALALIIPMAVAGLPRLAAAAPSLAGIAHRNVPACDVPSAGFAACDAILYAAVTPAGKPAPSASTPSGYVPQDLQSAYNLPSTTGGAGQTIGIVDAYNDPNVASDLGLYRAEFSLAPCTTLNGCLRVVSQTGGSSLPRNSGGWSEEISLDVDMASAICPNCKILLVEASSSSLTNLGAAVNEAVKLGATVVSNSYGGSESSSDPSYDASYFNHPGVAITVSSGDSGYGTEYPAASQYVTAVGGTTLTRAPGTSRGWAETVWSGAGSGCSKYDAQPSWQSAVGTITSVCSMRAIADVSAVADPSTGVAVYDSYSYRGYSGWLVFGGTSVAAPITASVYALAGNASSVTFGSYPYTHTKSLNDVTLGSNGSCGNPLCNATVGWDGPTGLGTPWGSGAF